MAGRRYGDEEVREIFSLATTGEQLRLSTLKSDATAMNGLSVVMGIMAVIMGAVITADGKPGKALVVVGMFAERAVKLLSNS